jgi:hypothetical protein
MKTSPAELNAPTRVGFRKAHCPQEVTSMNDPIFDRKPTSPALREARKAFKALPAKSAVTEHAAAQKVFSDNRERLKAERIAREAVDPSK